MARLDWPLVVFFVLLLLPWVLASGACPLTENNYFRSGDAIFLGGSPPARFIEVYDGQNRAFGCNSGQYCVIPPESRSEISFKVLVSCNNGTQTETHFITVHQTVQSPLSVPDVPFEGGVVVAFLTLALIVFSRGRAFVK